MRGSTNGKLRHGWNGLATAHRLGQDANVPARLRTRTDESALPTRTGWDKRRTYRLERPRERMKAHGLGALLLMYDENIRYVTATLTPGWCKLKPGLRYPLVCRHDSPVMFEH